MRRAWLTARHAPTLSRYLRHCGAGVTIRQIARDDGVNPGNVHHAVARVERWREECRQIDAALAGIEMDWRTADLSPAGIIVALQLPERRPPRWKARKPKRVAPAPHDLDAVSLKGVPGWAVRRMAALGLCQEEIAYVCGVSRTTVRRVRGRAGLVLEPGR